MMSPCNGCPAVDWCRKRGCICWNDRSREQYYEMERRAKTSNAEIDELEKLFGELP